MGLPNERKCQILAFVLECGENGCTSAEVSEALGIALDNASRLLRHYWKGGLLRRRRGRPGRVYIYRAGKNTERQLRFWRQRLAEAPIKARLLDDETWEALRKKPVKGKILE